MTDPTDTTSPLAARAPGSGTAYMVVGTLVAALSAYLFQLIAGRALGPTDFAPITVLWTIQFLVLTIVFVPMEQLTIRRLSSDDPDAGPWRLFIGVIALSVIVSTGFAALTLDRLLHGETTYLVITAALIAGYGGFALARGMLAGHRRFKEYGLSTLAESVFRLVLAATLLAVGVGAVGLGWTLVAGSLVVWIWLPFRAEPIRHTAQRSRGSGAGLATFVAANAASQTIVAAGPLVVGALRASSAEVSVFFETFLLFRAPLTVAYSLIARILPPFTRFVQSGNQATIRLWAWRLGALGAVGGALGYAAGRAVGPDLVAFLLGEVFRPTATLAAYAGAGVAIATIALFAQQILIAMRATGKLALSWALGLAAASLTVMVAGGGPSARVGAGFLVGEALALALIVTMILRSSRPTA
jgi:O-antigen/teichoic acid export membrane protein